MDPVTGECGHHALCKLCSVPANTGLHHTSFFIPTRELVVHGYEWMVRWEGACGALAMHQQLLQLTIHHMLLDLHGPKSKLRLTMFFFIPRFWVQDKDKSSDTIISLADKYGFKPIPLVCSSCASATSHLCNVVADVVDHMHVQLIRR